jgi:hypothetical protein
VWTDLQSNRFPCDPKSISQKQYQDICETPGERDTRQICRVHCEQTKNAAPTGMGNGVNSVKKSGQLPATDIPKPRSNLMLKWAKDAHKRTTRMVSYAPTLRTANASHGVAYVQAKRLTNAERASLVYAALQSLDYVTANLTASVVLFGNQPSGKQLTVMRGLVSYRFAADPDAGRKGGIQLIEN